MGYRESLLQLLLLLACLRHVNDLPVVAKLLVVVWHCAVFSCSLFACVVVKYGWSCLFMLLWAELVLLHTSLLFAACVFWGGVL